MQSGEEVELDLGISVNDKANESATVDLEFYKHLQGLSGQDGLIIAAVHNGP